METENRPRDSSCCRCGCLVLSRSTGLVMCDVCWRLSHGEGSSALNDELYGNAFITVDASLTFRRDAGVRTGETK